MSVTITAQMVNQLREQTGAGLMDCKKALVEANGNNEEALTILRKKGIASAAKKSDRATNAETLRRVLRGDERGPKRDAVLLNAGAALFVADRVRTVADGWEAAADLIDSGRAWAKLEEIRISR